MHKIKTLLNTYCPQIQFFILVLFFLTLPYNIANSQIGLFSILIFLCSIKNIKNNFRQILNEKAVIYLLVFILFSYLSLLWSELPLKEGDYHTNIDRFKYYFLIFTGIYFSDLNLIQIKKLFLFIAIAPILSLLVYYSNFFGISNLYASTLPIAGDFKFFSHYLIQNFYILFASLYLYLHVFHSLKSKNIKLVTLYLGLFILVSAALFIDVRTSARLINLAYLLMLIIVPIFYLRARVTILILLPIVLAASIYISLDKNIQRGIHNLKVAITTERYTGSWGARLAFSIIGLKIFIDNPIIGASINDVSHHIVEIKKREPQYYGDKTIRIHNGHINFLAQIGTIGYILFLIMIHQFYKIKLTDRELFIFKQSSIIIILFIMLGEHYFSIKSTTNFIAIIFALFVLSYKLDQQNATSHNIK